MVRKNSFYTFGFHASCITWAVSVLVGRRICVYRSNIFDLQSNRLSINIWIYQCKNLCQNSMSVLIFIVFDSITWLRLMIFPRLTVRCLSRYFSKTIQCVRAFKQRSSEKKTHTHTERARRPIELCAVYCKMNLGPSHIIEQNNETNKKSFFCAFLNTNFA